MIAAAASLKHAGIDAEPEAGERQQQPEPGERDREPAARATAPSGCAATAAPSTIGTSGSTQGDRIDSSPAAKASAQNGHAKPQRLLSSKAAIEASLVSPTERPCSAEPLKTISVDCI